MSVAFSPDGSKIVSGSSDKTIRVWDADTGKSIGEPIVGHNRLRHVCCFFARREQDRLRLVGQDDPRLGCRHRKSIGEPIVGDTDHVMSVSFSPDGSTSSQARMTIRSASGDADTGKSIGEPIVGDTDHVMSVSFSPDGSNIVSGSHDNTIRVWDADTGRA